MKTLQIIILLALIFTLTVLAQSKENIKQDSTQFKFWVSELNKTNSQLASLDSTKLELQGIAKYQYGQAIMEKRKIESYNFELQKKKKDKK